MVVLGIDDCTVWKVTYVGSDNAFMTIHYYEGVVTVRQYYMEITFIIEGIGRQLII